ncbi:hypothetical protein [Mesorhizobium sp. J428]|uniref:hypothetical protein n=1 Tax=Mesorhizobium sp. J428 TaxID=2898440 RepID=UPI002151BCE1|nr:hypothetical protein [Mesorhizobium sp. J428]MCR5858224.1 hypothetical protein [Mesorhizobium sp. J428]
MPRSLTLPSGLPAALSLLFFPTAAFAHASDRGYVLLLPTGHYIAGGALAVAASFGVLWLVPTGALGRLAVPRLTLAARSPDRRAATSWISLAVLALLIVAGWLGSRDPLSNPLPLVVWTLFWIGLTMLTGLGGNLFDWLDPWRGPARLLGREKGAAPSWLDRLGYAPAIVQFAAFAWFELVYPAPDDPDRLGWAVSVYYLVNLAGVLAVGHAAWTARCEPFSVFFRIVSKLAIVEWRNGRLALCLPGGKLVNAEPLPVSGVLFLLLALGSVSFDGLMRTFAWLGAIGVNPLEFPGRSAVMVENTAGLVLMPALLAAAFFAAVWAGERLSGEPVPLARATGTLVWSIAPITLAYHVAHYLIALLVNGQYALAAISDPFSRGWNLFGTADNYISAGLVMGPGAAWILWNLQAGAIVAGHVLAVVLAHMLAERLHTRPGAAVRSQIPLTVLMIGYTVFGLWLLSTPTGA